MIFNRSFRIAVVTTAIFMALVVTARAQEEAQEQEDPLEVGLAAIDAGDLIGAIKSLRIAADDGSAEAQAWLGYIFDYSEDDEEAVEYYRAAADQGNARGLAGLGEMYAKGEGVEQDLDAAREYFTEAAELGNKTSIQVLIEAYTEGGLGVEPDSSQAAYWTARLEDLELDQE